MKKDKTGKFRIPIGKVLLFVSLLAGCSDKKEDGSNGGIVNCIVSDKAVLEDIEIFPSDNPVNRNIADAVVDPRSGAIISLIGSPSLHADFGSGLYEGLPIGIPFILVCKDQSPLPVTFRGNDYDDNYGNESDPGPYPIPVSAPVEGNGTGDSHVLCADIDNRILYELYNASHGSASWEASSGAMWHLKTNAARTAGWTSADAGGMPILPLLVRYDEVAKGTIDHAIRFTLNKNKISKAYTAPASHLINGNNSDPATPVPMGIRIRLKKTFDISGFSATNQVILTAMKNYGLILTDVGSDLFISGAPDDRWDNDDLHELNAVKGSDFEVIQMGEIVTD